MTIKTTDGVEIALGPPEMRELFRFLLHHAKEFGNTCCWNGCLHDGRPYKVRKTHLNTIRIYCDRHAFAAEVAGFIVNPIRTRSDGECLDIGFGLDVL